LDPQVAFNKRAPSTEGEISILRRKAAEHLTRDFLGGNARVLLDVNDRDFEGQCDHLMDIVIRAAELSYKLWTQRTQVARLDAKGLANELAVKDVLRFQARSSLLDHHPLHNLEVSEDGDCLNGAYVAIVSHPAVVAYGDSAGQDFSRRKIWKKAVVWMLPPSS
jgi:hypothetical protein